MKKLMIALTVAVFMAGPAAASEGKKKAKPKKAEVGASCKAPAIGRCAACSISCPAGETATCSPGVTVSNVCHTQPACRCGR